MKVWTASRFGELCGVVAVVGVLAAGCAPPAPRVLEDISIPFADASNQQWVVAYADRSPRESILQYVPAGQSLDQWREMVLVHGFPGLENTSSPTILMGELEAKYRRDCRDVQWVPIESGTDDAAYEVVHRGCIDAEPAFEIGRFMISDTYLYQVRYRTRAVSMSQAERDRWMRALAQAGVVSAVVR
jgi:hypothetical protein